MNTTVRELVQSALNTGRVRDETSITLGELTLLESTALSEPLSGTISKLLPPKPDATTRQPFSDVLDRWLNIRQSFLDEQSIGKPAKIALTNHAKDDETVKAGDPRRFWTFKTAVVLDSPYQKNFRNRVFVKPVVAYELSIASNAPTKDLIVHRFGLNALVLRKQSTGVSSHIIDATFDYRTERKYDAKVLGSTVQYSPNYRKIGIGQYLGEGAAIDFRWRPYVGVVWEDVKNPGDVDAYKDMSSFTHEFFRLTGEIKLGDVIKVTPETTVWHGDRKKTDGTIDKWQDTRSLEARWIVSQSKGAERASIAVTGSIGRDSPDFKLSKQFVVAVALKF